MLAGKNRFSPKLFAGFVIAGFAAGVAIHKSVGANADVNHRLAQATIFLAVAAVFWLLTLCTSIPRGTGSRAHAANVACDGAPLKMTLVMRDLRK